MLEQLFTYESLIYDYTSLSNTNKYYKSTIENKSILLSKRNKTIMIKDSYIQAITTFNSLPNELKLVKNKCSVKRKLKAWERENV